MDGRQQFCRVRVVNPGEWWRTGVSSLLIWASCIIPFRMDCDFRTEARYGSSASCYEINASIYDRV